MGSMPYKAQANKFLGYSEIDNYIEQFGLKCWQESIDSTSLGLGNHFDTYA